MDILHEVDIVENIAVQYHINDVVAKLPDINTVAYENNWFKAESTIREVMVGLGFQEVMSLMPASSPISFCKLGYFNSVSIAKYF